MPSEDRVNIILPAEDRDLADRVAAALGDAGRSAAIRFALKCAAERLGISLIPAVEKKKRHASKKDT